MIMVPIKIRTFPRFFHVFRRLGDGISNSPFRFSIVLVSTIVSIEGRARMISVPVILIYRFQRASAEKGGVYTFIINEVITQCRKLIEAYR